MKVLIADDNKFNRQLLEMILSDHHYDFALAENGRQALDCVLADEAIDLVLMDVNMPLMDGIEATREIKKQCPDRFIPIVFVTALDNEETLAECLANGGDDFVPKPINEDVLIAKLKAHSRTIEFNRQLKNSNEELAYHRRVMQREHNIVENIFKRCTNRMEHHCDNIRYYLSPMSQFNGDMLLVERSFNGGVYVMLGDFTGHGLAAAIGCLPVSDIFFAMTRKKAGVGKIAREINGKLQEILPDNMFFCATLIELDPSGDRLTVWSGGMNDILIVNDAGKLHGKIQAQHMPLGVLDDHEFDDKVDIYTPFLNLRALVYTDGLVEATNGGGEQFGEVGLLDLLQQNQINPVEAVADSLNRYTGGDEQSDDIGLVEIRGQAVTFSRAGNVAAADTKEQQLLPWNIQLTLQPRELKNPGTIDQIIRLICGIQSAEQHESILYALITELYSNALEHGLLALDSSIKQQEQGFEHYYALREERLNSLSEGTISIEIRIQEGLEVPTLSLQVTDSGKGFDVNAISTDMNNNDGTFARGVSLVESLCEKLHYTDQGRTVNVTYRLQN